MRELLVGMSVRVHPHRGDVVSYSLIHLYGKAGVIVATESTPLRESSESHHRVRFPDGREAVIPASDLQAIE
jgi:hypothetical protein